MKRFIAALLTLMLCTTCAFADILSDGWQNADDAEIRAAIAELNAELAKRNATTQSPEGTITITGQGTAIQSVDVPFSPAKAIVESDQGIYVTLTSRIDTRLDGTDSGYALALLHDTGTYTCLVNGEGNWQLTFEPIVVVDYIPLPLQGTRSYVSDGFMLTDPIIIHVKAASDTHGNIGYFKAILFYHDEYNWHYTSGEYAEEFMTGSTAFEKDVILKTETYSEPDMYVLYVIDDVGVEWSIEAK